MMKKWLLFSVALNILALFFFLYGIKRLGGVRYLRFLFRNNGIPAWYEHRKSAFEYLPIDSTDVVFLGNSITHQGEWAELLGHLRYKNRGVTGDVIEGMRKRLTDITRYHPAAIFLLAGTNDLLFHSPDSVAILYDKLVADIQIQTPGTKIYLQSVLPVNNQIKETHLQNEDIRVLNKKIKQLAIDRGIIFIDIHSLMSDKEGCLDARYTVDGIHLNGLAYRIWADKLKLETGI